MGTLAAQKAAPLKFWISHSDAVSENLAVIEKLLRPLGLQFERSSERWAGYVYATPS